MADEYIRKQDAMNVFNRAVQDVGILDADDIETVFEIKYIARIASEAFMANIRTAT